MARIQPDAVEQIGMAALPGRLKQLKARYVPESSTPTKQFYWVSRGRSGDGMGIEVTSRRGVITLRFFSMERCPCEG